MRKFLPLFLFFILGNSATAMDKGLRIDERKNFLSEHMHIKVFFNTNEKTHDEKKFAITLRQGSVDTRLSITSYSNGFSLFIAAELFDLSPIPITVKNKILDLSKSYDRKVFIEALVNDSQNVKTFLKYLKTIPQEEERSPKVFYCLYDKIETNVYEK